MLKVLSFKNLFAGVMSQTNDVFFKEVQIFLIASSRFIESIYAVD